MLPLHHGATGLVGRAGLEPACFLRNRFTACRLRRSPTYPKVAAEAGLEPTFPGSEPGVLPTRRLRKFWWAGRDSNSQAADSESARYAKFPSPTPRWWAAQDSNLQDFRFERKMSALLHQRPEIGAPPEICTRTVRVLSAPPLHWARGAQTGADRVNRTPTSGVQARRSSA